jgi:hypothetical protein
MAGKETPPTISRWPVFISVASLVIAIVMAFATLTANDRTSMIDSERRLYKIESALCQLKPEANMGPCEGHYK